MGRHADPSDASRRFEPRVLLTPRLLVAAAVVLALVAGGVSWAVSAAGGCDRKATVRVAVVPELEALTKRLLADPQQASDGSCAVAAVVARQPLQTVADLGALEAPALPQVWVPDSSLWTARTGKAALDPAGSMGSSPVVLATSRDAVAALGWADGGPSWGQALSTGRPIAVPDLAASAEGVAALAAVRASLGGGDDADRAVVGAVLAAERGPALSPEDALAAGRDGSADAPLVPVAEQRVFATNRGAKQSSLVAVYPSEGSPRLDYPVLRVGRPGAGTRPAVDAVVRRLTSATEREQARAAGFRDGDGNGPPGALDYGIRKAAPKELPLDPAQVQQLLTRLASLAKPSRILAVFDVSTSMRAPAGTGTRVTLARDAAKSALTLVPDTSAIGLWDFAYQLDGTQDWAELLPTRALAADAGGGATQRQVLSAQLDTLPQRLAGGGTGLYDTTLAAVRAARANYDPAAVNSVLIVTDGANDDDAGAIQLPQLLATLAGEADPNRPVKVIAVGLGPDADLSALQQIADATGGAAYNAVDPTDLQKVLFDALRQRG